MSDLKDIRGIGNSLADDLEQIGISTVNELANASLEELEENDIRGAEKILNRAQKMGIQIKSGEAVEEEQKDSRFISTNLDELDYILGGGLQGGFLIGVSGEHKAGKTQLALQCLASAADTTDENAVYIETEPNRFQIDRIKTLCDNEDSYERIHKIEAYSSDPDTDSLRVQENAYGAVRDAFDDVAVVVVDSFVSNFRLSGRFEGRGDLKERSNVISRHLNRLQGLANHFDCPVLITLQVYGNPQQYSTTTPIWGGALLKHCITHLLHMERGKGELREAYLKGHPAKADSSVELVMPKDKPIESVDNAH